MASAGARAARNQEARQRLDAALLAISTRLDIPMPEEPRRMKDEGLRPIVQIEYFADFAEAVDAALASRNKATAKGAPGRDPR